VPDDLYDAQPWSPGVSGNTPVTAARLRRIELGIDAEDAAINTLADEIGAATNRVPKLVASPAATGLAFSLDWSPFGIDNAGVSYYDPEGVPAADRAIPKVRNDGSVVLVKPRGAEPPPPPDTTPPQVLTATATPQQIAVEIAATTDKATTAIVEWGTTSSYGQVTARTALAAAHNVTIGGLTGATLYHWRITVRDTAGNENTAGGTFTTTAPPAPPITMANYNPATAFAWVNQNFGTNTGANTYVEFDVTGLVGPDKNAGAIFRWTSASEYARAAMSGTQWKFEAPSLNLSVQGYWPAGSGNGSGKARFELIDQTVTFYWNGAKVQTIDIGTTVAGWGGRTTGVTVWQNAASAVTIISPKTGTLSGAGAPPVDPEEPPPPPPPPGGTGVRGALARQYLGTTRSGLPWHSGFWTGGTKSTARMNHASTWRGAPMDFAISYCAHGTWAQMADSGWPWGIFDGFAGKVVMGVPLLPNDRRGQWGDILSGSRDEIFRGIARNAVERGRGNNVCRIGWEANGNWYPWGVSVGTAEQYKQAFRRVVNLMRGVAPNMKFVYDQAAASELTGRTENAANRTQEITLLDPGTDYYDFVGVDHYDFYGVKAKTEAEWQRALRPPNRAGIQDYADYARAKGKGLMVPEWGVHGTQGYGDNPFFMEKMWQWFLAHSDILVGEAYFNEWDPYIRNAIWDLDPQNPQSAIVYLRHWGHPELIPPAQNADTGLPAPSTWYANGAAPSVGIATARSQARAIYNTWTTLCMTQSGMPVGMPAGAWRVNRPDQGGDTVSEGIAYGMLLTVGWGNPTLPGSLYDATARSKFDGLWRYYKHFGATKPSGLMPWRVSGTGVITGTGAATDSDVDVAFALVMAHRIWGSTGSVNYAAEATNVINAILNYEITPANHPGQPNIMKNGDSDPWTNTDQRIDPDYWFPAFARVFKAHTGNTRWDAVIAANYPLISYFNNNFTTGMVPDESNRDGTQTQHQVPYKFGYNSIRLWRLYLDYIWYGQSAAPLAHTMATKLANWSKGQVGGGAFPGNLGSVYQLNGTGKEQGLGLGFAQVYGAAALADASNSAYASQVLQWMHDNRGEGSYFGTSLAAVSAMIMGAVLPSPAS